MSANPEREQFASDLQLMKHRTERRLTPTECETLQSFPKYRQTDSLLLSYQMCADDRDKLKEKIKKQTTSTSR